MKGKLLTSIVNLLYSNKLHCFGTLVSEIPLSLNTLVTKFV